MKIKDEDLVLVERYLQGDIRAEEKEAIETRRQSDTAFDRLIKQQQLITDGFSGMQLIQMQEILQGHRSSKRISWTRYISWAAVLLLAFSGGWWWLHDTDGPGKLADSFYRLPLAEIERTNSNSIETDPYLTGLNQFASGDYNGCVANFTKVTTNSNQYWFAQYYKAHAEYQKGDFSTALNDFDRVAASKVSTLVEAAEWNSLLSALKNGESIDQRLQSILDNSGHFYHLQAEELEKKYH